MKKTKNKTLATITLNIPPLRSRTEDILPLATHLAQKIRPGFEAGTMIGPAAKALLLRYRWPGNVRELDHALRYALTMMETTEVIIEIDHLPPLIRSAANDEPAQPVLPESKAAEGSAAKPLGLALFEFEYNLVSQALKRNKGHLTQTAQELGLSRQTLSNRLKKLNALKKNYLQEQFPDL